MGGGGGLYSPFIRVSFMQINRRCSHGSFVVACLFCCLFFLSGWVGRSLNGGGVCRKMASFLFSFRVNLRSPFAILVLADKNKVKKKNKKKDGASLFSSSRLALQREVSFFLHVGSPLICRRLLFCFVCVCVCFVSASPSRRDMQIVHQLKGTSWNEHAL